MIVIQGRHQAQTWNPCSISSSGENVQSEWLMTSTLCKMIQPPTTSPSYLWHCFAICLCIGNGVNIAINPRFLLPRSLFLTSVWRTWGSVFNMLPLSFKIFFFIVAQIKTQIQFSVELCFQSWLCAYAIIVIKARFSHMPHRLFTIWGTGGFVQHRWFWTVQWSFIPWTLAFFLLSLHLCSLYLWVIWCFPVPCNILPQIKNKKFKKHVLGS